MQKIMVVVSNLQNFISLGTPYFFIMEGIALFYLTWKNHKLNRKIDDLNNTRKIDDYKIDDFVELKRKQSMIMIHLFYIIGIATFIIIVFLTIYLDNAEIFGQQVSFASTLTSIILSVIAIFMSIMSEGKADSLKRDFEKANDHLSKSTKVLNETTEKLSTTLNTINKFENQLNDIYNKIISLDQNVNEVKEEVKKQESTETSLQKYVKKINWDKTQSKNDNQ